MSARYPLRVLAATAFSLASPALAHACAVCNMLGNERNRLAFFNTTIFLSLVPLGLLAWGVIWLFRNGGAAMRDEFIDRDELPADQQGVAPAAPESPPGDREEPAAAAADRRA